MKDFVLGQLSYQLTGLLFKAHKDLGRYRNEKQYSDYFEEILKQENISYQREFRFKDLEKSETKDRCIVDFLIDNKIVLEFKNKDFLRIDDYYQVKRYLVMLNLPLGLLINFRQPRLIPKEF